MTSWDSQPSPVASLSTASPAIPLLRPPAPHLFPVVHRSASISTLSPTEPFEGAPSYLQHQQAQGRTKPGPSALAAELRAEGEGKSHEETHVVLTVRTRRDATLRNVT